MQREPEGQLAIALTQLWNRAGAPSYAKLAALTHGDGIERPLPKSTIGDKLTGRSLPTPECLEEIVLACLRHAENQGLTQRLIPQDSNIERWKSLLAKEQRRRRQLRERMSEALRKRHGDAAETDAEPAELFFRTVRDHDPIALGVHRPRDRAGLPTRGPLTPYIKREHDDVLRRLMNLPAEGPRLFLCTGEASTGKIRTIYEALLACVPSHLMVVPFAADELLTILASPAAHGVVSGTAIWLGRTSAFLSNARLCAALRRFIATSGEDVILAGSLWTADWERLAEGHNQHAQARELLELAVRVVVPVGFDESCRVEVMQRARSDSRLSWAWSAAERAPSVRLAQVLASGPALVERLAQAPPPTRAVLFAAMDISRLGCSAPLPALLLGDAAEGYLSERDRSVLGRAWLRKALKQACRLDKKDAIAALREIRSRAGAEPVGYRIAPFLDHHGRVHRRDEPVPQRVWEACVERLAPTVELGGIARAGARRGLYEYAQLLAVRAVDGDVTSAAVIAEQCERAERDDRAGYWWRLGADGGDPYAMCRLAERVEKAKAWSDEAHREAMPLWERAADIGDPYAVIQIAERLSRRGETAEAERRLYRAARAGDVRAMRYLAEMLNADGKGDRAEEMLRDTMATGRMPTDLWTVAMTELTHVLVHAGRDGEAERMLHGLADAGDLTAMVRWAVRLRTQGKPAESRTWLLHAAEKDHLPAIRELVAAELAEGHAAEAERWLRPMAEGGDIYAMWQLFQLHRDRLISAESQTASEAAALRWLTRAAERGDERALTQLGKEGAKDVERLWRRAVLNGHIPLHKLADFVQGLGRAADAKQLREYGLTPEGEDAASWGPLAT